MSAPPALPARPPKRNDIAPLQPGVAPPTSSNQALKLLPQPQVPFTFGLLNLKPEPCSPST